MIYRILLVTLFSFSIYFSASSQIASYENSEEVEKSKSITGAKMMDPGFDDFVVFWMRQGVTTFNQKGYLIKVDRSSLEVIDKILLDVDPKLECVYSDNSMAGPKCVYVPTFRIDKKEKTITLYCYKLDKSLKSKDGPIECFTGPAPKSESSVRFYQNTTKDLLVFSYIEKKKKEKVDLFHYFIYNSDLELINSNTIERPFKEKAKGGDFIVFDDGVAYIDHDDRSVLKVVDLRENKESEIRLRDGKTHSCHSVSIMNNGNILVCGSYSTGEGKSRKEGFFRAETHATTHKLIRYETMAYEKPDKALGSGVFSDIYVDDSYGAYFLVNRIRSSDSGLGTVQHQVYYMPQSGDNWKKDLPIPNQVIYTGYAQTFESRAFLYNDELYVIYNDHEKSEDVEANNYVIGDKKIGQVALDAPKKHRITLLQINREGDVERESIKMENDGFLNGYFTFVNGVFYSPTRYTKSMTYANSSVFRIDFK